MDGSPSEKLEPIQQTRITTVSTLTNPMNNFVVDLIIQRIMFETRGAQIVDRLHKKGYNQIFEVSNDLLKCVSNGYYYQIKDFNIDVLYHLGDASDDLKGLGLFAMRHRTEREKGIFIGYLSDNSGI